MVYLRIFLTTLSILIGVHHITMTFLFLVPKNPVFSPIENYVQGYIRTFFYQNWHLFSPNPGLASSRFYIKCRKGWRSPGYEFEKLHKENRFSPASKVSTIYGNIPRTLNKIYKEEVASCLKKKSNIDGTTMLQEYSEEAKKTCQKSAKIIIRNNEYFRLGLNSVDSACDPVRAKILVFYPKDYKDRLNDDVKMGSVEEIEIDI